MEEDVIEEALPMRDIVEQAPIRQAPIRRGISQETEIDLTERWTLKNRHKRQDLHFKAFLLF